MANKHSDAVRVDARAIPSKGIVGDENSVGAINWVSVTPNGKHIVCFMQDTGTGGYGYMVYDLNFTNPQLVGYVDPTDGKVDRLRPQHDCLANGQGNTDLIVALHWDQVNVVNLDDVTKVYYIGKDQDTYGHGHISPYHSASVAGRIVYSRDAGEIGYFDIDFNNFKSTLEPVHDAGYLSRGYAEINPQPPKVLLASSGAPSSKTYACGNYAGDKIFYNSGPETENCRMLTAT